MRVTDSFRTRSVIDNLNLSKERMSRLQEQLATGKRVNRPSDDPIATSRSMRLRSNLDSNIQYEKNLDDSDGFLSATEGALNDIHAILLDVRDLALKGANDTTSPREVIANELELILQNMVEASNTKFRGKYIFAGTETLNTPFTLDQNVFKHNAVGNVVNYRGNDKAYQRQLNENTIIDLNIPGSKIFDMTQQGGVSLFQTIWDLRNSLRADDGDGVRSVLEKIDTSVDQVLDAFLTVGTRKQLTYFNQDRFQSQDILLKERVSQAEDTDYGQAFVQFKAEENALNSALSAGARVISPSLLDYLK